MFTFLLGCLTLFLVLAGRKAFAKGDPRLLALRGQRMLVFVVFLVTIGFLLAGLTVIALAVIPVLLAAIGLHRLWHPTPHRMLPRFRTRYLDMAMNLRTRQFHAHILAGRYAGTDMNRLSVEELVKLFDEFADDAESCSLLAAYLDRRRADWRQHAHAHAHTRQAGPRPSHALREEEAYEILGLQKGSSLEEIGEAHRRLMKRLHPDTGGTTWLAAKLNAAK